MTQEKHYFSGGNLKTYRIITEIMSKRLTQKEGANQLQKSARQLRRTMKKVRDSGASGVIHGLVGKPSNNSLKQETKDQVIQLWQDKYRECEFNYAHFTQKLNEIEKIKISEGSVRSILMKNYLVDKKPRRKSKHRRERERKALIGEMIQIDTSPHEWLPGTVKQHLVACIDDATSKVLYGQLEITDGTLQNMRAINSLIRENGLPRTIYSDRASWFHYQGQGVKVQSTFKAQGDGQKGETQIGRALGQLGINLLPAFSAQAKGRIERLNRTFQDRLISELRLNKIETIAAANQFLNDFFIPDHNMRYAVTAASHDNAFIQIAREDILNDILCFKFTSTVRNDNITSRSKYYKLQLLPSKYRLSWAKAKVLVRLHIDGSISVRHCKTNDVIPFEVIEYRGVKEYKTSGLRTAA